MRYQSGALPTSYGYTHQRSDAVSGLDYYGARYYDPLVGQFTSADTMLVGGLNRYAYVGGNPETWVDPLGFDASPPCPSGMNPADCIQYFIAIVQFVVSVLTNGAATLPADTVNVSDVQTVQGTEAGAPPGAMEHNFDSAGMNVLDDISALFDANADPPSGAPQIPAEIGPGPNGEAPFDESYPHVTFRYGEQTNTGKRSGNGRSDNEDDLSNGGAGAARAGSGKKNRSAKSSSHSTGADPFALLGRVASFHEQFGYTDVSSVQFGSAPSSSSSSQPDPWQQLQQLLSPCACGAPSIPPVQAPAPSNPGPAWPWWYGQPMPSGAPSGIPDVVPVGG